MVVSGLVGIVFVLLVLVLFWHCCFPQSTNLGFDNIDTERVIRPVPSGEVQQSPVEAAGHQQPDIPNVLYFGLGQRDYQPHKMRSVDDCECCCVTRGQNRQNTLGHSEMFFTCNRNECCDIWIGIWYVFHNILQNQILLYEYFASYSLIYLHLIITPWLVAWYVLSETPQQKYSMNECSIQF